MSTVETFNEKLPRERSNQVVIISDGTVWFMQKKEGFEYIKNVLRNSAQQTFILANKSRGEEEKTCFNIIKTITKSD